MSISDNVEEKVIILLERYYKHYIERNDITLLSVSKTFYVLFIYPIPLNPILFLFKKTNLNTSS